MLAAEYATLPKSVKSEVTRFFDTNETWLADVLEQGRRAERFQIAGSPGAPRAASLRRSKVQ